MIGVFGGSGFYEFLDDTREQSVDTPYGEPSGPLTLGSIAGTEVCFLARHGRGHAIPAHRVNYRANVWAMRELGVRRIVGPGAVGSLRADLAPGTLVIVDQFVDRTRGRLDTYHDGPPTTHVSAADPYCAGMRATLADAAREEGIEAVDGGTMVVVAGPRFSTRAESRWFSAMGWDVVGMTGYPEAMLARELELCYAGIALVTDYDVGLEGVPGIEPVSADAVIRVLAENISTLRRLLARAVPLFGPQPNDACANALSAAQI